MASIRQCVCCEKDYRYNRNADPQWKTMFCGSKCKSIFETASAFAFGDINEESAKAKLKTIGVTDNRSCPSGVAKALKPLFVFKPKQQQKKHEE